MTRLLMVGPPGSGKGTQAQQLSSQLAIPHISTGDIFRKHVVEQTPLRALAQRHLDRGDLVSDSVTKDMVRQRLGMPDVQDGFLLDGFPGLSPKLRHWMRCSLPTVSISPRSLS